jgi:microcystin-dependent protein
MLIIRLFSFCLVLIVCFANKTKTNSIDVNAYLANERENIRTSKVAAIYPRGVIWAVGSSEIDFWFNNNGVGLGEYSGWYICDGRNGTPDLRGRVGMGRDATDANSDYAQIGRTGGSNSVKLSASQIPAHSHSVNLRTSTDGSHSHLYEDDFLLVDSNGNPPVPNKPPHTYTASFVPRYSTYYGMEKQSFSAGDHSHQVLGMSGLTGGNEAFDNRPPYYVLAYIIYVGV